MPRDDINPQDVRLYLRAVSLGVKQLATIRARLSGGLSRWEDFMFVDRNRRLKKTLLKILNKKRRRLDEDDALAELREDFAKIEADEGVWQAVGKEELDYVQIVMHGLQVGTADENGRLLDGSA
jgi:hypothetical protein